MNQTLSTHNKKPIANLSLDLDNEWAYLKTHGNPDWEAYPSYLNEVVPRILETLEKKSLKITVFVVGQDASLDYNRNALSQLANAGHEIGNHSLKHEPWLHLFSEEDLEHELAEAERFIQSATSHKPTGFRGPGYSQSATLLRVLRRRGYVYDASSLPSFIGPLARAYYFATGQFGAEQRERLNRLFGNWKDGFKPLKPYYWSFEGTTLLDFSSALLACRLFGVEPSILLHPLDFLGGEDVPRLKFFPSMKMTGKAKIDIVEKCLDSLTNHFDVKTVGEHAAIVANRKHILQVEPNSNS